MEATMKRATSTTPMQTRTTGRRRRRGAAATAGGGSVISEVDMALSRADGPQPAMETSSSRGAPPHVRRRQAVLAGHGGDHQGALVLAVDPDPTVRAAALGALLRLGALDDDALVRGLGDGDAGVRRRACELAGRGVEGAGRSAVVV